MKKGHLFLKFNCIFHMKKKWVFKSCYYVFIFPGIQTTQRIFNNRTLLKLQNRHFSFYVSLSLRIQFQEFEHSMSGEWLMLSFTRTQISSHLNLDAEWRGNNRAQTFLFVYHRANSSWLVSRFNCFVCKNPVQCLNP